jgi:hypothetical protein
MALKHFMARWLHLLASNGAERVNVPPHLSYPHLLPFKSPKDDHTTDPPTAA